MEEEKPEEASGAAVEQGSGDAGTTGFAGQAGYTGNSDEPAGEAPAEERRINEEEAMEDDRKAEMAAGMEIEDRGEEGTGDLFKIVGEAEPTEEKEGEQEEKENFEPEKRKKVRTESGEQVAGGEAAPQGEAQPGGVDSFFN